MFPVEIIEILLNHSNGSDIINFRLVCKTWNSIIDRLSKETNIWQTKCENEIPVHSYKSIYNKLYPDVSWFDFYQSKSNLKWLKIYRSWNIWNKIKETETSSQQFEPFFIRLPNVRVTCLSVSENLLAVGSSEGFIAFYNVDISTDEPIFIVDQMAYVTSVQFYRYEKLFMAVSCSIMDHVMVWDIESKTASGGRRPGRIISTCHGCLCIAGKHQLRILSKSHKNSYGFSTVFGRIAAVVADGDRVCPQCSIRVLLLTELGLFAKVNLNGPYIGCFEETVVPPEVSMCKYYLFGPWIAVGITRDGFLGISIDCEPWVMYEIFSKLHGVPTCVLFYSNVLVLGLDSGSVYVYSVNNIESLTSWDFRSENAKAIIVSNQAIVALDIVERPDKRYLIAASAEKVNVIDIKCSD